MWYELCYGQELLRTRRDAGGVMSVETSISSCGCEGEVHRVATPDEPIACTADLAEQRFRPQEYLSVFQHLVGTDRLPGGFVWRFADQEGLETVLRELAAKEHACCRFFEFRIERRGAEIVWETRADERATAVLEEYMNLPQTLRDLDNAALKRKFEARGLAFTGEVQPGGVREPGA